jgi:hypothetical protein
MNTFVIAFLCTDQVDRFDPLCDTDDMMLSLLVVAVALLGCGRWVARRLSDYHWYVRWPAVLVGAVAGTAVITALFGQFASRFLT